MAEDSLNLEEAEEVAAPELALAKSLKKEKPEKSKKSSGAMGTILKKHAKEHMIPDSVWKLAKWIGFFIIAFFSTQFVTFTFTGIVLLTAWLIFIFFLFFSDKEGHLWELFKHSVLFILLIFVVIWAVYFNLNTTGQYLSSETGTFSSDIKQSFRELSPELNMFKSIMLGEYDPNALWTSKEYEDRYATVKDAGVTIENVKPLREFFLPPDQDIVIIGNIKVVSLPGEDVTMRLSARTPEIGIPLELTPLAGESWDCQPSTLTERIAYLGRFTCTHDTQGIDLLGEYSSGNMDIKLAYDFDSKSGFQVFVANYNDIINLISQNQDIAEFYGITRAQQTSWETHGPVGVGMGILGESSILAANLDELNEVPHFLGVTVKNDAPGTLELGDSDLYVTLPCEIDVDLEESDFRLEESDFRLEEVNEDLGVKLCKYKNKGGLPDELKPGEYKNFYLKFYAWDQDKSCSQNTGNCDFLKGSPISSFFILSELQDYTYIEKKSVAFRLKKSPGQP